MIVTLLPLFLAANVSVNEGNWKYGPEVIYNAKVNAASYGSDSLVDTQVFNMTGKLYCRPKSDLILSCHFEESKAIAKISESKGNSQTKTTLKTTEDNSVVGSEIFELMFSRHGLEEIAVSSSINLVTLDMIRALVLQLNVGTVLTTRSAKQFDVMDQSSAGECRTTYNSAPNRIDVDGVDDNDETPYVLMRPGFSLPPGEIGQLLRTRHIDDCPDKINYFFGSREAHRENATIDTKLISSMSLMIFKRNSFTSFTENVVHVRNNRFETGASTKIRERVILSLSKIVPASGPLPKIHDKTTASILPTRLLYDDSHSVGDDSHSVENDDNDSNNQSFG